MIPDGLRGVALIGAPLALAGSRLLSRANLHWSWAAVVLGAVVIARRELGEAAPALAAGALFAGIGCRRRQREDAQAGADLAGRAHARRTPSAFIRRIWWLARAARGRPPSAWRRGQLLLGHDASWREVSVPLTESSGGAHTLVVGATGSGKTVTQCRIAAGAIEAGLGAVVIDPKGDPRLRDTLLAAAACSEQRMLEWTPAGPSVYNPFARGSDTEVADKALAGERYTEPHYLRQAQRYLGHAVRTLASAGEQISLQKLAALLDPQRLELLARAGDAERAQETHAYLDSLSARQRSDLTGTRDRLAVLAESDAGRWLDPGTSQVAQIDLLECVRAHAVVLFCLEADSRPLLSAMLASAIVQDLQTVVAALQRRPTRTLVLIDEFSAVAPEHVVRLFGRARSAGVSVVLGTQEISDLRLPGHERLLEQVMGNLSALIAHRQVVPASAELIAQLAGSRGAWRVTRHSGSSRSRTHTRVRQPRLDHDSIMRLQTGCAAVIAPGHGGEVAITRVLAGHTVAPRGVSDAPAGA
jgi:type IV secretory pathway TraG/TraD family ATPase VirD4